MNGPEWPKSTTSSYDPQGSAMDQDIEAPGIVNSGNMAHKLGADGDHTQAVKAPTGLKGE
jgi:hypothetical protein